MGLSNLPFFKNVPLVSMSAFFKHISCVFSWSSYEKMVRILTGRVVTFMADKYPVWYFSIFQKPSISMRSYIFPPNRELPVSPISNFGFGPYPAFIFSRFYIGGFISFLIRRKFKKSITVNQKSSIVLRTKPPTLYELLASIYRAYIPCSRVYNRWVSISAPPHVMFSTIIVAFYKIFAFIKLTYIFHFLSFRGNLIRSRGRSQP